MNAIYKKLITISVLFSLSIISPWIRALDYTVNSEEDKTDFSPGDNICETALDNGECTLRAAVQEANFEIGQDTVHLPNGNYILSLGSAGEDVSAEGDLDITGNLEIKGQDARETIIDGNSNDRVIHIIGDIVVSLLDLTITNGHLIDTDEEGAGIFNEIGNLSINRCQILDNKNDAPSASGGGISNDQGSLDIQSSTIVQNMANVGAGGGILNRSGNVASKNSTFSKNTAASNGGGIFNLTGTVTIESSTITQNEAAGQGGGLSGSVTIGNSIIAGNISILDPEFTNNCTIIPLESLGFNLFETECNITLIEGDQMGTFDSPLNPLLGPLQNNGGPTDTHALLEGSPAIDAGDPNNCGGTDQRGVARPQGTTCDIGAYEGNCGDAIKQGIEECDDGNTVPDDDCDNACKLTSTGGGVNDGSNGGCALIAQPSFNVLGILSVALGMVLIGLIRWRNSRI